MDKISATCTWGEGPDVLISVEDHGVLLMEDPSYKGSVHGVVNNAQIDLTLEEAEKLVSDLSMAIMQVKKLEKACEDHDNSVIEAGVEEF